MKYAVNAICRLVVAALALSPAVSAVADNPYGKIVVRNLFGLKDPPPPPDPESVKPPTPPISLQGFTTILGRNQVLFKVTLPAKPPQPATEVSKILGEGERDGDITVLEINLAEHSAKFDNYGTVEVKNLKDHAAKPGGAAPLAVGAVPAPFQPGGTAPGMVSTVPAPAAASAPLIPPRLPRSSTVGDGSPLETSAAPGGTVTTATKYGLVQKPNTGIVPGSTAALEAAARRTPEETAILYQANKQKNDQLRASGVNIPRLPNHPLLRDQLDPPPATPPRQ